ncbi:aldolase/citrate lyase family protein [Lutibacter sp.]|uniref:HpcH/HpaI aldolase/citrate lyase family protein n=1 Tax=Lutibacter sp. TaxID=1925666 RepID=UPI001A32ABC2|nr:aldolase/citrate lyase family protein [Lutibacter sp.]MBI9040883.1 HpcH/HpaI aldolase/citrate lyase family protein [Lutibacter sp.]
MKKNRRTMLYIPGNNPAMLQQGGIYGADSILLDLEDAVALNQKDAARILVRNVLKSINFYNTEVCVRINHLDTPFGLEDLEEIAPLQPDAIRYPKTETVEELAKLIQIIEAIEDKHNLPHDKMTIHAMIETALGVQNVFEIAKFSKRVDAITIGGQDLTADMNIKSTKEGSGIDLARKMIVMAAKANKIDAIDTVFVDINDEDGLRIDTEYAKQIGFSGKAVINPRQIDIIHDVYMPTEEEIRKAYRIVLEFKKNKKEGIGAFAIDGKMIDAPIMTRATQVLELANIDFNSI